MTVSGDQLSLEAIIKALHSDAVVTLISSEKRQALYDFMEDHDLDPSDYRVNGTAIWAA